MDTISPSSFHPVPPDGYVLSSSGTETPKIEITETDPLCQTPPECDVALSDWDDFHQHGDSAVDGDYLGEQSPRRQRHEAYEPRGGSFSRRSEGGPGKCPSPSRSSPRRHSPVPYSPKRQHRSRNSSSPVASDEFADVNLSPRRHSPVPFLPPERPCSLPLTSGTSEEFICVSYSDPFSSPTITHTSEGILAISISCRPEVATDHDVEMLPSDISQAVPENGTDDSKSCRTALSSSTGNGSLTKDTSLLQNGGLGKCVKLDGSRSQSESNFHVSELSAVVSLSSNDDSSDVTDPVAVDTKDVNGQISTSFAETAISSKNDHLVSAAVDTKLIDNNLARDSRLIETEQMEDECCHEEEECCQKEEYFQEEECFQEEKCCQEEVSSSDSSSDDDMEDVSVLSHSSDVTGLGSCVSVKDLSARYSPTGCGLPTRSFVSTQTAVNSVHPQPYKTEMVTAETDVGVDSKTSSVRQSCESVETKREKPSEGIAAVGDTHQLSDGDKCCTCITATSITSGRTSVPGQQPGVGCSSSPCCMVETSPRKASCGRISRSPEDFDLACLVGHPPLHFPHGENVALLHCSLLSPYDPDLPTPPIVITPHTSYDHLTIDFSDKVVVVEGVVQSASQANTSSQDSQEMFSQDSQEMFSQGLQQMVGSKKPDISRSRSFPNLHQDSNDRFQEPDQSWPVLGDSASGLDSDMDAVGEVSMEAVSGAGSRDREMTSGNAPTGDLDDVTSSGSLPASPSNSRAAVIGRLRRVVERRLSSTSDTCEAPPAEG